MDRRLLRLTVAGLVVCAFLVVPAAPMAVATPRYEPYAYYSVVADKPYAPYTVDAELQRTSIYAYFSVVRDKPYAPYTETELLKRTSIIAYRSVVADAPYAAYTAQLLKLTSPYAYYSVLH